MARRKLAVNKTEEIVIKLGGAIRRDYLRFRDKIQQINENIMPFFFLLGFRKEDRDKIIETLVSPSPLNRIREVYFSLYKERIKRGEISLEGLIKKKKLDKKDITQEERERLIESLIEKRLTENFIVKKKIYLRDYYVPIFFDASILNNFADCLIVTPPSGLEIDVDKFLELYQKYLELKGGLTSEEHQRAADALNRFFNGALEISFNELSHYFLIKDGILVPNPKYMNRDAYTRLGLIYKEQPIEVEVNKRRQK